MALRILVGEAADQGMKGMVCVAEVLRHRGSIKGFHGYRSLTADHEPERIWKMAAKAWKISKYTNYTKGADHFLGSHAREIPPWVRSCVVTYRYKDHIFYKTARH